MSCLTPEEFETIRRHPLLRTRAEFAMIVETVCAEFGVDPALIYTPNRGEALTCEARNMVCLIANQRGFPKMEIGRLTGRNVTTIRHAIINAERVCKLGLADFATSRLARTENSA